MTRKMLSNIRLTLIILFTLFLGGCFLAGPTGPRQWDTAEVSPLLICPDDPVDVVWRASSSQCLGNGCPPAPTVDIVSQPDLFSGNPIPTTENFGSRTIRPDEDTTITLNGTAAGTVLPTKTFDITLVLPEGRTTVDGQYPGVCLGRQGAWAPLVFENSRTDRVAVLQICNTDRAHMIVTVDFGGRSEQYTLQPNDCTEPEFTDVVVRATARPVALFDPSFSSDCDVSDMNTTGVPPRSIEAGVVLFCRPL